jgi:hypothetical protein
MAWVVQNKFWTTSLCCVIWGFRFVLSTSSGFVWLEGHKHPDTKDTYNYFMVIQNYFVCLRFLLKNKKVFVFTWEQIPNEVGRGLLSTRCAPSPCIVLMPKPRVHTCFGLYRHLLLEQHRAVEPDLKELLYFHNSPAGQGVLDGPVFPTYTDHREPITVYLVRLA